MITAPHMPYRIPLVMLCGLMIATVACNATPIAKVEPAATPTASTAPSCQEALPIVGGGIVEFIQYKDIDELIKSADLIVVGTPLTELGPETTLRSMKARDRYDDFKMPLNQSLVITDPNGGTTADWTLTGFKVEQTLKGKLPATNLQILEPGIVISGKSVPKQIRVIDSAEYTPLRKGKRYLLFLQKTLPTPTAFFDQAITYTTALHQGKYNLDRADCPEAALTRDNAQHRKLLNQLKPKYPKLFPQ
jgi:hypothetical protein